MLKVGSVPLISNVTKLYFSTEKVLGLLASRFETVKTDKRAKRIVRLEKKSFGSAAVVV